MGCRGLRKRGGRRRKRNGGSGDSHPESRNCVVNEKHFMELSGISVSLPGDDEEEGGHSRVSERNGKEEALP